MPYNRETNIFGTKQVTLATRATSTIIKLTTSVTATAIAVGDYGKMVISAHVVHNSTVAPGLYLQESIDGGTTWGAKHTIDADMTTTANYTLATLDNFGDTVRVIATINGLTTTTNCTYTVHAILKR